MSHNENQKQNATGLDWTLSRLLEAVASKIKRNCPEHLPRVEVIDTGILKTAMPRHYGHLVQSIFEEERLFPLLREVVALDKLAAAEIKRHGVPSKPSGDDLIRTKPAVLEACQLREAYEDIDRRLQAILSPRVLSALIDSHGGMRKRGSQYWAIKDVALLIQSAIKIGVLGQRMAIRQFEPEALRGRKVSLGGKKGHVARYGTNEQREQWRARLRAEYQRIQKGNPHISRTRAAGLVAKRLGTSTKTILRYTASQRIN
jgi:hypothetical protein